MSWAGMQLESYPGSFNFHRSFYMFGTTLYPFSSVSSALCCLCPRAELPSGVPSGVSSAGANR